MTAKKQLEVVKLAEAYIEACREEDAAQQKKKALSASLLLLIPANEELAGVKHIVESKGSPSWKQVADRIGKELVPASRRQLIEPIITACTGKPREYIRRVKDDYGPHAEREA